MISSRGWGRDRPRAPFNDGGCIIRSASRYCMVWSLRRRRTCCELCLFTVVCQTVAWATTDVTATRKCLGVRPSTADVLGVLIVRLRMEASTAWRTFSCAPREHPGFPAVDTTDGRPQLKVAREQQGIIGAGANGFFPLTSTPCTHAAFASDRVPLSRLSRRCQHACAAGDLPTCRGG